MVGGGGEIVMMLGLDLKLNIFIKGKKRNLDVDIDDNILVFFVLVVEEVRKVFKIIKV